MYRNAKVHLVAFADGAFIQRKEQFVLEAKQLNVFDEISFFTFSTLPKSFLDKHKSFLENQPRGFGYWIWKPVIIELALAAVSPGDIVVYIDAGTTLNKDGRSRFLEYLDIALDSSYKMLSFQNIHTEYKWTKADLAKRLGVLESSCIMNTSQLSSGFIVLCNTQSNIDLIREWKQIAVEESYRYSDDSPSELANHKEFEEHRHDQSISSLLRKLRGTAITHYEVQAYAKYFEGLKSVLPVLATRLRK